MQPLSSLVDVKTIEQPNGDLSVFTSGGLSLPTQGATDPFSIAGGTAQPGAFYPAGGLPGIMVSGNDVTSEMTGGQIGADLTLRDQTLPTDQAELDEFAFNMSSRFSAQGLNSSPTQPKTYPAAAALQSKIPYYVGYSAAVQVNPTIIANPSLIRDGTQQNSGDHTNPAAGPGGVPPAGPAGFTDLISRVLNYTFGSQLQAGVAQPAFNSTSLGADGTLTAPISSATSLSDYATDMVSSQAQQSAATTGNLATEQALQTSLTSKVAAVSGVSMDTEMSMMITLQNAYGVNARIITAVQSMFSQLLQAVQ